MRSSCAQGVKKINLFEEEETKRQAEEEHKQDDEKRVNVDLVAAAGNRVRLELRYGER